MPDDLNLKTVIEAVLDAKGFEEFKARVQQAAKDSEGAGAGAAKGGEGFAKLGKALPHSAFMMLSQQMLANAGMQGNLGPLTRVSTVAMQALAGATGAMSGAMAGATLGISILLPLILSMRKSTEETAIETRNLGNADEGLIEKLERVKASTVGLTEKQDLLLAALKRVREFNQRAQMEDLQKAIKETTDRMNEQFTAAMENVVAHERTAGGIVWVKEMDRQRAEQAARTAAALRNLKDQETVLLAQMDGTTEGTIKQAEGLDKAAAAASAAAAELVRLSRQQEEWHAWANDEVGKMFQKWLDDEEAAREAGLRNARKSERERLTALDRYTEAHAEANRDILRNDVLTAKTDAKRRQAEAREFQAYLDERVAAFRAAKMDEKDITAWVESMKRAEAQKTADLERMLIYQKASMYIGVAGQVSAQISAAFGESKATAYANAVIGTAQAVVNMLASGVPPPGNFILAGIVAALGAIQIAKIESTERGFDDPANDALVAGAFRNFGRKWASDMTSIASAAAAGGFGEGMRGFGAGQGRTSVIHQTTKIDRGTHIENMTFNGAYFSPRQAMVEFERRRIRVGRIEDRTRRRSV